MGTTAQKLEYLGTTKSQLKDMINYGLDDNNKITSSTTFRNYVSSIFNAFLEALRTSDTLFTNLPKKSGSGSNITLNDTANAPMRITLAPSELSQDGTPTPSSPQAVHTISGSNKVVVSNSDNTISQEADIDLDTIEYCKIGNYADRIFKNVSGDVDYSSELDEGAWYIKKNIGKVVLDGTEDWTITSTDTSSVYRKMTTVLAGQTISPSSPSQVGLMLCNRYLAKSANDTYLKNVGVSMASSGYLEIYDSDFTTNDVSLYKTWLSSNNVILYYVLATPTYTPITGTLETQLENVYQKMLSYTGTTNISQVNNDLSFNMSVSVIKEIE